MQQQDDVIIIGGHDTISDRIDDIDAQVKAARAKRENTGAARAAKREAQKAEANRVFYESTPTFSESRQVYRRRIRRSIKEGDRAMQQQAIKMRRTKKAVSAA